MKLDKNEYTISSLKDFLVKKFGKKTTGKEFTIGDIHQYLIRGYLPHKYGGNTITVKTQNGIKIITLNG